MKYKEYTIKRPENGTGWNVFLEKNMAWTVQTWMHYQERQYAIHSVWFRNTVEAKKWIDGGCEIEQSQYEVNPRYLVWGEDQDATRLTFQLHREPYL